jgi:hypothetical protein
MLVFILVTKIISFLEIYGIIIIIQEFNGVKMFMLKTFFPQSKVQDTLYHYTISENVENIKNEGFKTAVELGGTFAGTEMDGIYFTPSEVNYWGGEAATQFEQIAVKVNLKNPLDLSFYSDQKKNYTEQEQMLLNEFKRLKELGEENYYQINGDNKYNKSLLAMKTTEKFKEAGYDGLIIPGGDGLEYVVFDKTQIQILNNSDKSTKDKIHNLKYRLAQMEPQDKPPYRPTQDISKIDLSTLRTYQNKKQNG